MSIYQPLRQSGKIVTSTTTRGLWGTNNGELISFFTSSTQNTDSKDYYYEVWVSASLTCNDEKMFSVTYGHISGSGSLNEGGESDDTPSRAVYSQYRLNCLDGDEGGIILQGSTSPITDFYAININRDKFGDKLDPGNFEINIAELSGSGKANNVHTGSNVQVKANPKIITLIDDSSDQADGQEYASQTSPARNLVSGSLQNGIYNPSNPHYYGKVYPSQGVVVISAHSLNQSASFNSVTGSNINGDNSYKLFTAISGAAAVSGLGFSARAIDIKSQYYYYVSVPNNQNNYTSNPTYVYQSSTLKGKIKNNRFIDNPKVYISTIGLYAAIPDENNPARTNLVLVAVAKLSKPLLKSFNNEISVTVKLEY